MSAFFLPSGHPKTVIVTGGAGGIGAQTIRTFHAHGCNVVIADLSFAKGAAESLIASLSEPSRALFHETDITDWQAMRNLFRSTKEKFGQVDIVIANAGLMESIGFFDFDEDETGELKEPKEAYKIIDVNLKGSMNTLRLAMHAMQSNDQDADGARGSVILIASTSGYFGGTSVVSYISSKHGVVGLARASQRRAAELDVRVNVVAPFFTPTHITTGYSEKWRERGLPANTVEGVADTIVTTSTDPTRKGHSVMVAGSFVKEIETARTALTKDWLGEDIANVMAEGGKFFDDMGGYTLPKARP
ncbi:3-hydroxyacyl-CoA dehydrogenase type-2 [Didymella exigua CBS 183.55]|uniref:3-hydroxyacyl-CoA dehydrogenase type-2 n=1 Tax=Didymella exigua CBS 183.55 TaxID=1150837 RepID=A0A6A5RE29_9PLEO|nr:3-hydroxyacyl-CoA dehydrogenase type-2 [Didymella exigua CBS 183.55]KAF1925570.1 3-hydroxyacyl-CoA dehydrogenase type-2 [Didymella exigua CBS 183.55]